MHYISKESAKNVYGSTYKHVFTSTHLLIKYFDVGIHQDGYWNYDHQALQNEDFYDVISVLYPNYNYVILSDQSSGHGTLLTDALHAPNMSVKWGGNQPKMHTSIIHEVGPYNPTLSIGETQNMQFQSKDKGPFYLKLPTTRKYSKDTGKRIT